MSVTPDLIPGPLFLRSPWFANVRFGWKADTIAPSSTQNDARKLGEAGAADTTDPLVTAQ